MAETATATPPADTTPKAEAPVPATPAVPAPPEQTTTLTEKPAVPEAKKEEPAKPESKPGETKPEAKAPATYDLKLPEGSLLDKTDIERIVKTAKENEFAQEDAQALLEAEHEAVKVFAERQKTQMIEAGKTWMTESQNDKEVGGEKFKENAELARRVVTKFGTPQLMKALTDTGLGNHPELVRIMVRIGKAIGDDQLVLGASGTTPAAKSKADVLYPKSASQG